jgi:hypothetical protein
MATEPLSKAALLDAIRTHGPVISFHPDETFLPSSVEFALQRSSHFVVRNGQCIRVITPVISGDGCSAAPAVVGGLRDCNGGPEDMFDNSYVAPNDLYAPHAHYDFFALEGTYTSEPELPVDLSLLHIDNTANDRVFAGDAIRGDTSTAVCSAPRCRAAACRDTFVCVAGCVRKRALVARPHVHGHPVLVRR